MSELTPQHILEQFRYVWQVDKEFTEPLEDGFCWWPGHHKVTVRCEQQGPDGESDAWRVTVTTEYAKGVDLSDPKILRLLGSAAVLAPSYGWVYAPPKVNGKYDLPQDGGISFKSSVYIRPETADWLPRFFARVVVMQPVDAERLGAAEFLQMLGGEADRGGPRVAKPDHLLDDILNVAQVVFAPAGQESSRWSGSDEFGDIAERFGRSDMSFGNGGPEGLTLETPFGSSSALVRCHNDVRHPALGSGLLTSIQLPVFDTDEATLETCAWLNFFASVSWTGVPVLGSWHAKEVCEGQFAPAYGTFIPNALYAPGLATNLALWGIGLARWSRQALWPELEDLSMREILQARLGS